jgi:hypothetical protein
LRLRLPASADSPQRKPRAAERPPSARDVVCGSVLDALGLLLNEAAVCSTAKGDMVSSIGADHVIDYRREDFAERKHHYDVILDVGGSGFGL